MFHIPFLRDAVTVSALGLATMAGSREKTLERMLDLATLASSIFTAGQTGEHDVMTFILPDMSCGHCVATVTKTVKSLDPSAEVKVDLASKAVSVETTAPREAIAKRLEEAGYPDSKG